MISWHNLDSCDFKSHTTLPLNDSYVTMLGTILTIFKYIINYSIGTCVCRRSREKQKTTSERELIDENKWLYVRYSKILFIICFALQSIVDTFIYLLIWMVDSIINKLVTMKHAIVKYFHYFWYPTFLDPYEKRAKISKMRCYNIWLWWKVFVKYMVLYWQLNIDYLSDGTNKGRI